MSTFELPLLEQSGGLERELGILLLNRGSEKVSLPLGSVDIAAKVINQVAQVSIKQVFRNDCTEHLEAVYIFPLAAASAVYSFNMKVGKRTIKGVVQERAEARQQYQQAVSEGRRAALLEQERDDVFTVQVGNLPPGEEVTVEISYSERLPFYENGCNELRLPLVVSPRYIPGVQVNRDSVGDGIEEDTDLVPDASRITPPRLASGVDPQTELKLKVEILPEEDAELSDLACSQHATKSALSQGGLTVSLARADERLNRDFVLRWRSTGAKTKSSLITYTAPDGETYGLLSIMPPKRSGYLGAARDIVFVLDRSGSMQGVKMNSAIRACNILLNTLGPNDRFAIVAFDNACEWMPVKTGGSFLHADAAGLEAGEKFLRGIEARGGTELDRAMQSAFAEILSRSQANGRVPSLVVLTDGEVGNESQILQRVQRQIGDARLFVVGIDTAVNSGLLKRLANLGGGTATFVEPGIQLEEALASIGREIGAPLVTDIQVESLELTVDRASLSPSRVPDVFAGRSSICFLKLIGKGKSINIKGKLPDGKKFEQKLSAQKVDLPAIAQLWAKAHIVDLEDDYRINPNSQKALKKQIIQVSVSHSILTKFTAFVVLDEAEIVNNTGDLRKVVQPVEQPADWDMCKDKAGAANPAQQSLAARKLSSLMGSLNRVNHRMTQSANDEWGSPASDSTSDAWGSPAGGKAADGWSTEASDISAGAWGSPAPAGTTQDAWNAPMGSNAAGSSNAQADLAKEFEVFQQDFEGDSFDALSSHERSFYAAQAPQTQQPPVPPAPPAPPTASPAAAAQTPSGAPEPAEAPPGPNYKKQTIARQSTPKLRDPGAPTPKPAAPAPKQKGPFEAFMDFVSKKDASAEQEAATQNSSDARKQESQERSLEAPERQLKKMSISPPATPREVFGSQSGSYGMGVRQQVFEVIVRQAIAGAPWKEICQGPMQTNNITEREVQDEVDRRLALKDESKAKRMATPPVAPTPPVPPTPPAAPTSPVPAIQAANSGFGELVHGQQNTNSINIHGEVASVRPIVINLISAFEAALYQLEQGQKPDSNLLETARAKLVFALAPLKLGMEVPRLQGFLRTTAIDLINCLKDSTLTQQDIYEFWKSRKADLANLKQELERVLDGKEPAFWEVQV